MANAITAHTIVNGTRNLILQFNMVADGTGELSDFPLLDLNNYLEEPGLRVPSDFKVIKVSGRTSIACSFKLFFGAPAANRLFFEAPLATDVLSDFSQDWSDIGGLITGQPNTDLTVRITTSGFAANNDSLSLVIWIKKKYK